MSRIALLLLLLSPCGLAFATGVLQASFEQLCLQAKLIIEGQVVKTEARTDSEGPFIWTHVTIEITELIEGEFDAKKIELAYLGGSVGGRTLRVARMTVPVLGERGVFFVESMGHKQVHPLLGWQQGHFRIESGPDGVERVTSFDRRPVSGISRGQLPQQNAMSTGVAAGVQIRGEALGVDVAMRVSDFKATIRDVRVRRTVEPQ